MVKVAVSPPVGARKPPPPPAPPRKRKKAVELFVMAFSAQCPCGGDVVDREFKSFQIEPHQMDGLECTSCGAEIEIRQKTAKIN